MNSRALRAAIVDKDRQPRWRPDRLEAVDEARVQGYFAPLAEPDQFLGRLTPARVRHLRVDVRPEAVLGVL